MDDSIQDTDKGFGTGLRRQLERRREGEEAAEAPREAPAHVVAEEILTDLPVGSSENKGRRPTWKRFAPSWLRHLRASATFGPRWPSRPRCSSASSPAPRA